MIIIFTNTLEESPGTKGPSITVICEAAVPDQFGLSIGLAKYSSPLGEKSVISIFSPVTVPWLYTLISNVTMSPYA